MNNEAFILGFNDYMEKCANKVDDHLALSEDRSRDLGAGFVGSLAGGYGVVAAANQHNENKILKQLFGVTPNKFKPIAYGAMGLAAGAYAIKKLLDSRSKAMELKELEGAMSQSDLTDALLRKRLNSQWF